MTEGRLTLDNPVFKGTLRVSSRSVSSYSVRPMSPRTVSDIMVLRRTQPGVPQVKPTEVKVPNEVKPAVVATQPVSPRRVAPQRRQTNLSEDETRSHEAPRAVPSEPVKPSQPVPPVKPRARKPHRKLRLKRALKSPKLLYAAATLLLLIGVAVNVQGIMANAKVQAQVKTLQKQAHVQGASTTAATSSSTGVPPSTEKPAATAVRSYTVAPALPKYIDIKSLSVHARVLSMSVDANNELQAPYSIWDAGWYNASSQPGQAGAMLIDGHSGIGVTHGIFHDLGKLKAGDVVGITKGDNSLVNYKVVDVKTVGASDVDMASMLVSADATKPGLNIITCTGKQIAGTTSLDKRVLVHAVMQ